jgi:hypothetical protein
VIRRRGYRSASGVGLLLLALTGCDPIYGISGSTVIQGPADDACIASALRETPGVKDVETKSVKNEAIAIVGDAPLDGSMIRYFTYDIGDNGHPTMMIEEFSGGRVRYSHTMLQMHEKIPMQNIDRSLPTMHDADEHISRLCHVDLSKLTEARIGE